MQYFQETIEHKHFHHNIAQAAIQDLSRVCRKLCGIYMHCLMNILSVTIPYNIAQAYGDSSFDEVAYAEAVCVKLSCILFTTQ